MDVDKKIEGFQMCGVFFRWSQMERHSRILGYKFEEQTVGQRGETLEQSTQSLYYLSTV